MNTYARRLVVTLSLSASSLFAIPTAHAQAEQAQAEQAQAEQAQAGKAECRGNKSVLESAKDLKSNTDKGGHVSIHVKGQKTEAGKSQFKDEASYQAAWAMWTKHSGQKGPKPTTCGGGDKGSMDCVPASLLGITNKGEGYTCDKVDDKGKCTAGSNFAPVKVAFRFAKNDKGVWILNTAYPTKNDKCQ